MDKLRKKFINLEKRVFKDRNTKENVTYYVFQLENDVDNEYQSQITLTCGEDLVLEYGLDKSEIVDALRSKMITLSGVLYHDRYNNKMKFKIDSLDLK